MSKREKYNTEKKTVCKFMNYRLSDGIRNVLLSYNDRLFKFRDKRYQSDRLYYMTVPYYLDKYREREIIEGISIAKRKKVYLWHKAAKMG